MTSLLRRAGIVGAAVLAIFAVTITVVFACHNTVTLRLGPCDTTTGKYQVTAVIGNSEAHDAETLSGATILAGQIDNQTVAGGGTLAVTGEFAPGSGRLWLTVTGHWPTRSTTTTNTSSAIDVPAPGACLIDNAAAAVTTTPATCTTGEQLTYGAISNAIFTGTPDGTTGPGTYTVTATATPGSAFPTGQTTETFTGPLAGPTTAHCAPPKLNRAHFKIQKYPSCLRSERFVLIVAKDHVARTTLTHGPHRQRWVANLWAGNHATFAHGRHHVRVVVHLTHKGACHQPSPGSGRT